MVLDPFGSGPMSETVMLTESSVADRSRRIRGRMCKKGAPEESMYER